MFVDQLVVASRKTLDQRVASRNTLDLGVGSHSDTKHPPVGAKI